MTARAIPDLAALEDRAARAPADPWQGGAGLVATWHGFDTWAACVAACSVLETAQKN